MVSSPAFKAQGTRFTPCAQAGRLPRTSGKMRTGTTRCGIEGSQFGPHLGRDQQVDTMTGPGPFTRSPTLVLRSPRAGPRRAYCERAAPHSMALSKGSGPVQRRPSTTTTTALT
jgi:hypothetical protein